MFDPVDHDLADRHEAILLGREARHAARETYLAMHDNLDGTFSGRFTIPELHGSLLRQAIERLSAPRRTTSTSDPAADLSAPDAPGSGLGGYEKAGHAFCEIIEHLPTTGWTGANALTFLATMNLTDLINDLRDRWGATTWAGPDETGTVRLDTGTTLSAGDFRRLACEAGLVPVVLGGDSAPLDLGRLRRLHDIHQRRALAVIWTSCAITGCERPFAWCEIHHPKPWSEGGGTDLHNALPLCFWHHHRAHDPAWDLTQHPTHGWRLRPAAAKRRRRPTSPDG